LHELPPGGTKEPFMQGIQVRKLIFLGLFLALFLLVARLFYPFMTIILWSGLIYALLYKFYGRCRLRRDRKERREPARTMIAGAFALGGVLLIVVPVLLLAWGVVRQVGDLVGSVIKTIETHPEILDLSPDSAAGGIIYKLSQGQIDLSRIRLLDEVKKFLAERSGSLIGLSGTVIKNAASIILTLTFMVFSLYFFFVDGEHLTRTIIGAIPIEKSITTTFLRKLRDSGRQLLLGYFLVSVFQATMMFILCLIFSIKGPLVIAFLTAVASFIPMLGTALVWLPISAGLALSGETVQAIAFCALSAVFVATLDNFIRPVLLHERLKIHPLLIFFSILGGLQLFGFNGVVLGPLILMLFFSAADLIDQAYERESEKSAGDA
jgi:predicted PurR-regulated permease PerM